MHVHQKYPSRFLRSIEAASSLSIRRPWRSDVRVARISAMIVVQRRGLGLDRAGERIAAERAEADGALVRRLAGEQRQPLVVDHDQRAVALHDGRGLAK